MISISIVVCELSLKAFCLVKKINAPKGIQTI